MSAKILDYLEWAQIAGVTIWLTPELVEVMVNSTWATGKHPTSLLEALKEAQTNHRRIMNERIERDTTTV